MPVKVSNCCSEHNNFYKKVLEGKIQGVIDRSLLTRKQHENLLAQPRPNPKAPPPPKKQIRQCKIPEICPPRIDQLAIPTQKLIEGVLQDYNRTLEAERIVRLVKLAHANRNERPKYILTCKKKHKKRKSKKENCLKVWLNRRVKVSSNLIVNVFRRNQEYMPNYRQLLISLGMYKMMRLRRRSRCLCKYTKQYLMKLCEQLAIFCDTQFAVEKPPRYEMVPPSEIGSVESGKNIYWEMRGPIEGDEEEEEEEEEGEEGEGEEEGEGGLGEGEEGKDKFDEETRPQKPGKGEGDEGEGYMGEDEFTDEDNIFPTILEESGEFETTVGEFLPDESEETGAEEEDTGKDTEIGEDEEGTEGGIEGGDEGEGGEELTEAEEGDEGEGVLDEGKEEKEEAIADIAEEAEGLLGEEGEGEAEEAEGETIAEGEGFEEGEGEGEEYEEGEGEGEGEEAPAPTEEEKEEVGETDELPPLVDKHPPETVSLLTCKVYEAWMEEFGNNIIKYGVCLKKYREMAQAGKNFYLNQITEILKNWGAYIKESTEFEKNMTQYLKGKDVTRCKKCGDYTLYNIPKDHEVPRELKSAVKSTVKWKKLLDDAEKLCKDFREEEELMSIASHITINITEGDAPEQAQTSETSMYMFEDFVPNTS